MSYLRFAFFIAGQQRLNLKDLSDVYSELYNVRAQWQTLGGILKVHPGSLDAILDQYRNVSHDCLREILRHWLKQVTPLPTWEVIVDALRKPEMNQAALARDIKAKHCPGIFTMIEVLYYTSPQT